MRSFSYIARAGFSENFRYTPYTDFSEEFLLHSSGCLLRSFSYTPDASFSEEFLLHSSDYV